MRGNSGKLPQLSRVATVASFVTHCQREPLDRDQGHLRSRYSLSKGAPGPEVSTLFHCLLSFLHCFSRPRLNGCRIVGNESNIEAEKFSTTLGFLAPSTTSQRHCHGRPK